MLYKWNHIVLYFDFFPFTITPLSSFQIVACLIVPSFLMLSSVPKFGCTTVCLTVYLAKDIPEEFIWFLAIANKAAINIHVVHIFM